MIDNKEVLDIVKEQGPVIPRDVVKVLGSDTMMVGAVLSDLVDKDNIKISHTKIGGSPVYYCRGQEPKLQELYKHLKDMEKKAYNHIKERKIIRDSSASPAIRVALRKIKDFAKALEVNLGETKEIFWKWYLLDNSEAKDKIRFMLGKETKKKEERRKEEPKEKEQPLEERRKDDVKKREEKQEKLDEEKEEEQQEQQYGGEKEEKEGKEKDSLLNKVDVEFEKREITILEKEIKRKGSDIEMIIKLPSAAGELLYFCKIRDKKSCNDKDLSAAYVQGQMKKLPVLFVTTGKITKKAQEMLDKEFKMITLLFID